MAKIGATPSTKPFTTSPVVVISETTEKLRAGEKISLEDIPEEYKNVSIFLDEQSRPFVFYISDQQWYSKWRSEYKFHFKWCHTLANMKSQGREKRYRAKYDICNSFFDVNDGSEKKELKVCLNCCKEFPKVYEFFGAQKNRMWDKEYIVKKFRMPEFFDEFGIIDLPPSVHPGGRDGYGRNWPKVSRQRKEKAGWRCQDCHEDFTHDTKSIDVHHISGVKSDNSLANLEVVCRACHAKKPGHEHMR